MTPEHLGAVRRAFATQTSFDTSPLYTALSRVVAADDQLVSLAAQGQPGQWPTFLFFGAIHQVVSEQVGHPLAQYFESLAGVDVAPPHEAGPALIDFCRAHGRRLSDIIRTRLVQTNHVQRSLNLRFALAEIAGEGAGSAHVVEVGASAGLSLLFDRCAFHLGDRIYGMQTSPVTIHARVYGDRPLPDLDCIPLVRSLRGVDLNPLDVSNDEDCRWLEALIWPENHDQREQLALAMSVARATPPELVRGDAATVLPDVAAAIPRGEVRVAYHCATRMHVPVEHLDAFDAGIAGLGRDGPLWIVSVEAPDHSHTGSQRPAGGIAIVIRNPSGVSRTAAVVSGHARWIEVLGSSRREGVGR